MAGQGRMGAGGRKPSGNLAEKRLSARRRSGTIAPTHRAVIAASFAPVNYAPRKYVPRAAFD